MLLSVLKTKDLLIYEEEMKKVAGNVYPTTDDGSYGRSGMVTNTLKDLVEKEGKSYDVCVAIGPMIMMKFVCLTTKELEHSDDRLHESDHGRRNRYVWRMPSDCRRMK